MGENEINCEAWERMRLIVRWERMKLTLRFKRIGLTTSLKRMRLTLRLKKSLTLRSVIMILIQRFEKKGLTYS